MKNYIRKIIREEIDKLFEVQDFQMASEEELAKTKALYKIPRKGIDDMINYANIIATELEQDKSEEEKQEDLDKNTEYPAPNAFTAPTSTNVYETYTFYGGTQAAQDNLDFDRGVGVQTGFLDKDAQETVDWFNDNIKRELSGIKYPGDTGGMTPPGNIERNW